RPVDGISGAEFVADIDSILYTKFGVLANIRRLRRGAGCPHGMVKGLGSDHRALDPVLLQRFADAGDDFVLAVFAESFGGDDVGIVSGPVADSDFAILPDDLFETDRLAGGRIEQCLSLIGRSPLGTGDEILAAHLGAVRAAARLHQSGDQTLLLFLGN